MKAEFSKNSDGKGERQEVGPWELTGGRGDGAPVMMVVNGPNEGSYKVGCFPAAVEDEGTRADLRPKRQQKEERGSLAAGGSPMAVEKGTDRR